MFPLKVNATLSLDEEIFREIAAQARRVDRSLSQFVTRILAAHIEAVEQGKAPRAIEFIDQPRHKKRTVTLTIDSHVLEKTREYAQLDVRPLSQYVNLVLRYYLIGR